MPKLSRTATIITTCEATMLCRMYAMINPINVLESNGNLGKFEETDNDIYTQSSLVIQQNEESYDIGNGKSSASFPESVTKYTIRLATNLPTMKTGNMNFTNKKYTISLHCSAGPLASM